jgi:hypothetical protein
MQNTPSVLLLVNALVRRIRNTITSKVCSKSFGKLLFLQGPKCEGDPLKGFEDRLCFCGISVLKGILEGADRP